MQLNSRKKKIKFVDTLTGFPLVKGCFLFLFGLFFLLQQGRLPYHNSKSLSTPYVSNRMELNDLNAHFTKSAPFSSESNEVGLEMETTDEDDSQNSQEDLLYNLHKNFTSAEDAYNCFLRSRYLQLTYSAQKQPLVPFFILYHSWKQHLQVSAPYPVTYLG